jgi:hypothetical protein
MNLTKPAQAMTLRRLSQCYPDGEASSEVEVTACTYGMAFLLLAPPSPAASPSATPAAEFYKEDHLTGADYLALYPSGQYEIVGREHMGIFRLERGSWRRDDGHLVFTPESGLLHAQTVPSPKPPYRGRRVVSGDEVFLVWSSEKAAGLVVPEAEVRSDLAKGEGRPSYVFFRLSEGAFRCETGITYPFRFYTEMNDPKRPKCEDP